MKKNYLLIVITVVIISVSVIIAAQRLQLNQHAAGNIVYASPGDNLASAAHSLSPGDTLILHDGLYSNASLDLSDMNGSSTAPITIKAEHDGQATIDGGGQTLPIVFNRSSFITVEGLVAKNSSNEVVASYNGSHDLIIRRVTGYNATTGNKHVFDITDNSYNILLEDDGGAGNGRYIFIAYHSNNVTFRRTWAKWTSQSNFSPAPRSCYGVYGSSNVILENTICWNAIPTSSSDTDYFTAVWQTTDGPTTDNISYYGVMFYNNWEGLYVNDLSNSQNTKIVNSYFENNRQQGGFTLNRDHGDGIAWHISNGGQISSNTFVNNEKGFQSNGAQPILTDNVFLSNDTASDVSDTNGDLWQNGNNGSANSSDKKTDPGYNITKYGKGAYLFVPSTSPLHGAGSGGGDIGANILYEYVNGQLTNTPLWPWPMEDRIKAETGSSVTWETGGGFWKTLDGVYPNGQNPSISPLPTTTANNTNFTVTICPHGLGNCGDNANATGGNTALQHPTRQLMLTLLSANNMPVATGEGTISYNSTSQNFTGTVQISNVPAGQYTVTVKTDGFLPKQISQIITVIPGQPVTVAPVSLVNGDVNNDGQLDIIDYNLIISCYGTKQTTASCINAQASDINDDGVVNGIDYNLFIRELSVQR